MHITVTMGMHKSHVMEEIARGNNSMSVRAEQVHFKILVVRSQVVEAQELLNAKERRLESRSYPNYDLHSPQLEKSFIISN